MAKYKLQTRQLLLMLSLVLSGYVSAEDTAQNENKYKRASNNISDADNIGHVGSDAHPALVRTQKTDFISDAASPEDTASAEEAYRQQREAFRRYLENRHQQRMSAHPDESLDSESRRQQFINDIEQRRELIDKLYQHRRKAIEERRQQRLLEMHKTGIDTSTVSYSS